MIFAGNWQTDRVRLRAVEIDDWKIHFEWDRSTDVGRQTDEVWYPDSTERARRWAEDEARGTGKNDYFRFQIEALSTGDFVGTINTHSTDARCGTFGYGIAILPEHQRRGYAKHAVCLVLRHFFAERRYQKCNSHVYSYNPGSIQFHEALGFTLEGRLRRMRYTQGAFHDELVFGMTDDEFYARYGK